MRKVSWMKDSILSAGTLQATEGDRESLCEAFWEEPDVMVLNR